MKEKNINVSFTPLYNVGDVFFTTDNGRLRAFVIAGVYVSCEFGYDRYLNQETYNENECTIRNIEYLLISNKSSVLRIAEKDLKSMHRFNTKEELLKCYENYIDNNIL